MPGFIETSAADTLIILGDAGINYFGRAKDWAFKCELSRVLPITLLCIHGNHERRPESVGTYQEAMWHGGIVYVEPSFQNLLFAKDGEVYDIEGKRCIAIGGAYSVDKPYRLAQGWHWFSDEQPSPEIKARVEELAAEKTFFALRKRFLAFEKRFFEDFHMRLLRRGRGRLLLQHPHLPVKVTLE